MAATGKTPILLYGSTTATNAPSAGNLTNSSDGCEIAINVADKNLFFKDSTNAVNTVPIRQSSASSNGWLSSTDWSTFNSKQPAGTYVTSVTGTAPVVSSGGTTPAISMAAATGSVNGYLTSTDWTTFNSKQAALVSGTNIKTVNGTTLLGSGDLGTIAVGYGGTGQTSFGAGAVIYGNGSSALSASSKLYFSGTQLSIGNSTPTADLTVYTTTGFSFSNPASAGVELGARATGAGYIFNTPSLNTTYTSGLSVYGSYSSSVSTVNLTAYGVYSAGGYYSKMSLSTANGTTITEQVNINGSTGNVTVATGNLVIGTSGKGIDFSATPGTGTSELFADYEEGDWTPAQGAGLTVVGAFSSSGKYTKVGRVVTVRGTLTGATSVASSSGGVITNNLPFNSEANYGGTYFNAALSAGGVVDAAGANVYAVGAIAATTSIYFTATYFV